MAYVSREDDRVGVVWIGVYVGEEGWWYKKKVNYQ